MNIHILTLFTEMFRGAFEHSILARAQKKGLIKINIYNLRDWANDKHNTASPVTPHKFGLRGGRVDDTPYGGGAGMVLKVDVIDRALHDLKLQIPKNKSQINSNLQISKFKNKNWKLEIGNWKLENKSTKIVLLTPKGKVFNQAKAQQLSKNKRLILICGHYEGFDERVRKLVDEEISIGNYILTGGEIPAMVLVDSISRLVPGVINPESLKHESFSSQPTTNIHQLSTRDKKTVESCKPARRQGGLKVVSYLEYPQYTRPEIYKPISIKTKKNLRVPKILLSGNHAEIEKWRMKRIKVI